MRQTQLCFTIALILSFICGISYANYDLGQPVPLDTTVASGSTGWFQSDPAIASSGSMYVAVWVDMRDAGRPSDLFATRISADGIALDPAGIRLTTNSSVAGKPDVCWDGQNFLVVYSENIGTVGTRLVGRRISTSGAVLDENPIIIYDTGFPRNPRVVYRSGGALVAWVSDGAPAYGGVHTRGVSSSGIPDTAVRTAYDGAASPMLGAGEVAVAAGPNGSNLVVWSDDRNYDTTSTDLYCSTSGMGGGFPICTDAGSQETPDCCWADGQFQVVWTDRSGPYQSIRGMRVSVEGRPIDWVPAIISFVTQKQSNPRVAWNGTNCLVTWARKIGQSPAQFDIYAGRIGSDESILDNSGFPVCAESDWQIKPCVGTIGGNFLVCWMDSGSGVAPTVPNYGFQVRGRRVSGDGRLVGAEFPLSRTAPQDKASCTAYNGRQFLVCWDEWSEGVWNLCGELIDAYTGRPVTTAPFRISSPVGENCYPSAAWNGAQFVVTWVTNPVYSGSTCTASVMAARVTPAGEVLDPAGIIIFDAVNGLFCVAPAIASDGNRSLILYRSVGIQGVFLSQNGMKSSSFPISSLFSLAAYEAPAVCWTGQSYFVSWKQMLRTSSPSTPGGIYYTTVSPEGVPSTTQQITDTTFPHCFKLACSGRNILLAAYGPQIVTRRFSLDGTLIDTTPVVIPDSVGADCVDLAWNGSNYVLTWMAARSDTTSAGSYQDDMLAIRINGDNQLVDTAPIAITDSRMSEVGGSMCAGPKGRTFLAYAGYEGAPYGSIRAKGMYLDEWMNLTALGQVKDLFDGAHVSMSGGPVVSALFPDRFYIQESRSFGIGIKSGLVPALGDTISFTGRVRKLNGEPVIETSETTVLSSDNSVPKPVGMSIRDLGGAGSSPTFTGVQNARGLYNVGLLVNVIGQVRDSGSGYICLDDGSGILDASGVAGVKVLINGSDLPAVSSYVKVTGVSAGYESDGNAYRLIRAVEWTPILDQPGPPPL